LRKIKNFHTGLFLIKEIFYKGIINYNHKKIKFYIIISKKKVSNATSRNRIKRIVREIFRKNYKIIYNLENIKIFIRSFLINCISTIELKRELSTIVAALNIRNKNDF
jgi:ribonuclease P protein component